MLNELELSKKTIFSFEVFPPKKDMPIDTIFSTLDELKGLNPDFISVLPVHHQLPEFTQTHVHGVSDAIQPSHPLLHYSIQWRRQWQPIPVLLPGRSHGRSFVGCSPWGC